MQSLREMNNAKSNQLPFDSGIKEIHQIAVLINDSVLLTRVLCSLLGAFRGRGQVVNRLVLLPSTELIANLDFVFGCCHGGQCKKYQKQNFHHQPRPGVMQLAGICQNPSAALIRSNSPRKSEQQRSDPMPMKSAFFGAVLLRSSGFVPLVG